MAKPDKRERKRISNQLAHINRQAEIFAGQFKTLPMKKVWSCLAHLCLLNDGMEVGLPSRVILLEPLRLTPVAVWTAGKTRISGRSGRVAA